MSSGPLASRDSAQPAEQLQYADAATPAAPGDVADSAASGWAGMGLLEELISAGAAPARRGQSAGAASAGPLYEFLHAATVSDSLRAWLKSWDGLSKDEIVRRLSHDVASIDALLNDQVNAILHQPAFQRLEASWRGLKYLVDCAADEGEPNINIRVLNVSWRELERDFERSIEFDQSQLFQKVYSEEFGMPGGKPFGMLIGDYEASPSRSPEHPQDDVAVLRAISGVAAASFCPFITSASPAMFELEDFTQLENPMRLDQTFDQLPYLKWRSLRDSEDARFLGLTVPRVLMRLPHQDDGTRTDRFRFVEDVSGPDRSKYLWGNAAFAFGETVIRAYAQSGWLADIRGVQRGVEGSGLVTRLPVQMFGTDKRGVAPKAVTDVVITDQQEKELADLGLIPLCHCQDSEYAAFYSCSSIQKPKKYDRPAATQNAKLSGMLQYMLCVSQFSRYLKVIARDKIGSFMEATDLQKLLEEWIVNYVAADESASPETKSRYPLREARIEVRPHPGRPGSFLCTMHLWPHFELDELTASVRFKAELTPASLS